MFYLWKPKPVRTRAIEAIRWTGRTDEFAAMVRWGAPVVYDAGALTALTLQATAKAAVDHMPLVSNVPVPLGYYICREKGRDGDYAYFEMSPNDLEESFLRIGYTCIHCGVIGPTPQDDEELSTACRACGKSLNDLTTAEEQEQRAVGSLLTTPLFKVREVREDEAGVKVIADAKLENISIVAQDYPDLYEFLGQPVVVSKEEGEPRYQVGE